MNTYCIWRRASLSSMTPAYMKEAVGSLNSSEENCLVLSGNMQYAAFIQKSSTLGLGGRGYY